MQRQIFIVDACIVDANGTFNHLDGYPKIFDSRFFIGRETDTENSVDLALKRATGDMSEVFGAMCKVDTRQLQTVTITSADGRQYERRSIGAIADLPDPNEEETTE